MKTKEFENKLCDANQFNRELIKAQEMAEKLANNIAGSEQRSQEKLEHMRKHIFSLYKKLGLNDYDAIYQTHYYNNDWHLLS